MGEELQTPFWRVWRSRKCQSTPKTCGEETPQDPHPQVGSDGSARIPVYGLIVPVLLPDHCGRRHVGAPHNCLQSLHKALAESALKRETL